MSSPFIGEIRMFAGNFAPKGWAFCNGQLLTISQYTALFSILGTTYGGNGTVNFALPNLQGRVPKHYGSSPGTSSYSLGESAGVESVTILPNNMPIHNHLLNCFTTGGNQASPQNAYPAVESTGTSLDYSTGTPNGTMNASAIGNAGGSVPISIVTPFQCVSFIIALVGIFPSRN